MDSRGARQLFALEACNLLLGSTVFPRATPVDADPFLKHRLDVVVRVNCDLPILIDSDLEVSLDANTRRWTLSGGLPILLQAVEANETDVVEMAMGRFFLAPILVHLSTFVSR